MNTRPTNRQAFRSLFLALLVGVSASTAHAQLKNAPPIRNLDELKQLSGKIVGMSERCVAATVCLMAPNGQGAGSGVIVSEDGLILTAAHVRSAIGDTVVVIFNDGTRKPGKSLGADNDRDAAMVQLNDKGPYPYAEVGSSEKLMRNQWCVAIGHAGGFDPTRSSPLRLGRVLQNTRFITTDSVVVGGDSGGPLYDIEGNVIGIHSNIGASLSENRHVPIKAFRDYWEQMKKGETRGTRFSGQGNLNPNRTILGTQLAPTNEAGGVPISGIIPKSAAEKAGLKAGDIITGLDKKDVESREKLIAAIGKKKPGTKVTLSITRADKKQDIEVTLGRLGDLLRQQNQRPEPKKNEAEDKPKNEKNGEKKKEEESKDEAKKPNPKKKTLARPLVSQNVYFTPLDLLDETKTKPDSKEEKKDQADTEKADAEKPDTKKADDEKDALDKYLDKALKLKDGRVELKFTPEAIKQFGKPAILKRARQRIEKQVRAGGNRGQRPNQNRPRQPQAPDEFFVATLSALSQVTSSAGESTVQVLVDDKNAALGTVVASDGLIVTKNTETEKGKVTIQIGKQKLEAKLLKRFAKRDLAVFKIDQKKLKPIQWIGKKDSSPIGSILTMPGTQGKPLGIGLLSVLPRTMARIGYLGVQTDDGQGGVLIRAVLENGAAEKAGIKQGDIVTALNGQKCSSPIEFGYEIRKLRAGDTVKLDFIRNGKKQSAEAKLNARGLDRQTSGQTSGRARAMNEMSGPLSKIKGGFPEALQHDIPILPSQCGGPLLNLNGKCLGINVSRAGRVKTFAIPANDIQAILAEVAKAETKEDAKPAKKAEK
jgi:serine protease Do